MTRTQSGSESESELVTVAARAPGPRRSESGLGPGSPFRSTVGAGAGLRPGPRAQAHLCGLDLPSQLPSLRPTICDDNFHSCLWPGPGQRPKPGGRRRCRGRDPRAAPRKAPFPGHPGALGRLRVSRRRSRPPAGAGSSLAGPGPFKLVLSIMASSAE